MEVLQVAHREKIVQVPAFVTWEIESTKEAPQVKDTDVIQEVSKAVGEEVTSLA